jgi:LacI family transcriptional regulator
MRLFAGKITKPVAILDVHGEDYHIIRRREGFLQYAEEHQFPVLVQEYSGYRGTEISVEEISGFLQDKPELIGIFITNCMAHRVAEAAKRQKNPRDFLLIGYDLIPNNRLLLQEGRIDAIISQHPEDQGREAVLNMYRSIVLEQQIPAKVEITLDVYFKESIPS